jgi:predicted chitinase
MRAFEKDSRYRWDAIGPMCDLLKMISNDGNITDIRWTAYMLATVYWETTSLFKWEVPKTRKGKPLLDKKGRPIMLKKRAWLITMAPVDEVGHGAGRRYHEPVKVKEIGGGNVRITEQDGDQFQVSSTGAITKLTSKAKMGTTDGGAAVKAYDDDDGDEHAYYGRGYVQLTWWSNYAKAGVAIGKGLKLLLDPELVKDPQTAYELMSHGMRTGFGFANGHKFADYFSGKSRDYKGARHMVNGSSHAAEIAAVAEKFEKILLEAKPVGGPPSRLPLIAY